VDRGVKINGDQKIVFGFARIQYQGKKKGERKRAGMLTKLLTRPALEFFKGYQIASMNYFIGSVITGAGATVGSGLDPQEALTATPRAAARISAIFIFSIMVWFWLVSLAWD